MKDSLSHSSSLDGGGRVDVLLFCLEPALVPVVGVLEKSQFGVSLLPLLAPRSFRREFGWPVLALAKDHSVALFEFLNWTVYVNGIGIVLALLSGSICLALSIDSPGREALQFGDLVLGDTDRILHDTPMVDGVAGGNRH